MSPWAWLKFTIFLWLLRKTVKLTGWLLLAAAVIAAWPVTVVAAAGYAAAWLRGWPPVRLYRTAAWALPATLAWLAALEVRTPGLAPGAADSRPGLGARLGPPGRAGRWPGRSCCWPRWRWRAGWRWAGVLWAWRIYAITTGLGGITASAPIIFDARQWNRQARTALGRTKAPGASRCWPGAAGSRSAAPSAPSGTAGTPSSPSRPRRAPGTWSSSARPAAGRRT